MPASFTAEGILISNAQTRINLANPSLLETCLVQGEATFERQPTNGLELSAAIQPTKVDPTAGVVNSDLVISLAAEPTPNAVAATEDPAGSAPESAVAATSTIDDGGKPGVPKWVWIVVGVAIALIVIGLSLGFFFACRRRRAVVPDEEESAADTREVADERQQEPGFAWPIPEILHAGGQVAPSETSGDTQPLDDIVEGDDDPIQPAGRKRIRRRRVAQSNEDEDMQLSSDLE